MLPAPSMRRGGERMRRGSASHSGTSEEAAWLGELQRRADGKLVEVDEAPHQACQTRGHIVDEGTRRCCQHRACVDGDQHKLYAMSKGPAEEDSTTGAASIGVGYKVPMSPATLRVDEVVGKDDGDADDEQVLDEDEDAIGDGGGSL